MNPDPKHRLYLPTVYSDVKTNEDPYPDTGHHKKSDFSAFLLEYKIYLKYVLTIGAKT